MNNVDDDTIIIIIMMMMTNGYRKLTKYTPFIHSIIHSIDQWIEQPFYSYQYYWVWMMNWFFTIFIIHLHFESAIFHPLIEWVSEWVSEWFVWYWRIQHSIQISNCETTIDITTNYNYQVSNTSDLIPLLSNW